MNKETKKASKSIVQFSSLCVLHLCLLFLSSGLSAQTDADEDWYNHEEESKRVGEFFASAPWEADGSSYRWATKPVAQRVVVARAIHIKSLRLIVKKDVGVQCRIVVVNSVTGKAVEVTNDFVVEADEDAEAWEVEYFDAEVGLNLAPGSYFIYPEIKTGVIAFLPDVKSTNFQAGFFRIYDGMYTNEQLAKEWVYQFNSSQEAEPTQYIHYGPFLRWLIRPAQEFEIVVRDTSGLAQLNALVGSEDTVPEKYAAEFEAMENEIAATPVSIDLYNKRGMAYSNVGKYALAIKDFNQVLQLDSINLLAITNRGMTYAKMGEFNLAVQDFDQVIKLDPQDPLIYYIKGYIERQIGLLDEAIFDFTKSIAFNPRDALTFYMRGRTKTEKGDAQGALDDFEKALLIEPTYWAVFKYRAMLYSQMKNYDLAIEDFNKAIKMNPTDSTVYFLRGTTFLEMGNPTSAMEDFSQVVKLNPEDIHALSKRAESYDLLGNFDAAVADYNKILEMKPTHYQTYYLRGLLYLKNKEFEKACADFKTASNSPTKELEELINTHCKKF